MAAEHDIDYYRGDAIDEFFVLRTALVADPDPADPTHWDLEDPTGRTFVAQVRPRLVSGAGTVADATLELDVTVEDVDPLPDDLADYLGVTSAVCVHIHADGADTTDLPWNAVWDLEEPAIEYTHLSGRLRRSGQVTIDGGS